MAVATSCTFKLLCAFKGSVLKTNCPKVGFRLYNSSSRPYASVFIHDNNHRFRTNKLPPTEVSVARNTNPTPQLCRHFSAGYTPRRLKLMDFGEIMLPNLFKMWRNMFFKMLIRSFDVNFSAEEFLHGTKQAVVMVSSLLAAGDFDALEALVDRKTLGKVKYYHQLLTPEQQQSIAVSEEDIINQFIYEIGMIFDDLSKRRFVEITVVIHTQTGKENFMKDKEALNPQALIEIVTENTFFCNYKFIKEYTKDVESDWTISALNHFKPVELSKS